VGYSAGLVLRIVLGIMDDRKPHPTLTAADKEARRRLAIRKVLDGRTQADVADFLGVHPVTVAKWMAAYRAGGEEALTAKPVPGRPRFLSDGQEAEVRSWLLRKPTEFGFRTDLWTAARVAQLIRDKLGVAFHPSYLREWLSKRGYSPQKPARRAKQRDPVALDSWLGQGYPAIQKKSPTPAPTSC
jgi:transposase